MKTGWKIFMRDLRRLKGNYIAIMVLIGICVIPSLYAWFNIYANMDPYANTGNIRIAVVNNDAGTEDDRVGKLNAGASLEEKLRENHKLGWVFTKEETAIEGVKSGEFYAAIVIPESFSRDLASVFTKDIHQPQVTYYSNMKKNAIAPKITDSGVSTIVQGINEEFVASLTETVAETVLDKAGQEDKRLESVMDQAKKAVRDGKVNTKKVNDLIDKSRVIKKDGDRVIADGTQGLTQAKEMAKKTENSLGDAQEKLSASWKSINKLSDDLRKDVNTASKKLTNVHSKTNNRLGRINGKVREIDEELNQKADPTVNKLQDIISLNKEILDGLTELNKSYKIDTVSKVLSNMKENNKRHQHQLDLLRSGAKGAKDLYDSSANAYDVINDQILETYPALQGTIIKFDENVMKKTGTALTDASSAAGRLQGLMESLQDDIDDLMALLNQVDATLESADRAFSETGDALKGINSQLDQVLEDLNTIENMEIVTRLKDAGAGIDSRSFGSFLSSPVELKTEVFYPIKNYGSGMTPFYTNLAIWVGCVILINLFKLDVDEDEKLKRLKLREIYFGRWFIFIVTALIQAFIVCAGDMLLPGMACRHPVLFVLAGLCISFVYMNLIYAINATFKHVGKALCVLLVILQIPGSSGTFPIQMSPGFFQALHPFLPFTYGVAAMREAMGGLYGHEYLRNLAMLMIFIPVSLVIGLLIRPLFVNLLWLFDRKMAETDLLASERNGLVLERHHIFFWGSRALAYSEEEKAKLLSTMDRFERWYPKMVRGAFLLVALVPSCFLLLMMITPQKLLFLILWIGSILLIVLFLLVIEYIKDHLNRRRELLHMSPEELIETMKKADGGREEV